MGHGLRGADAIAISPDGSSVYVGSAGRDDTLATPEFAIATFSRDATTGQLSQAAGAAGCVSDGTDPDCTSIAGPLTEVHSLLVAPDGKNLYAVVPQDPTVQKDGAIVAFARNTSSGVIEQLSGTSGCIANTLAGCTAGRALREPYGIAVTPGGNQLYVAASEGVSGGDLDGAVVVLNRTAGSGALTQPAGAGGCINATGMDQSKVPATCTAIGAGKSLHDANSVVVSPDGANVYVAAQGTSGNTALEYGALDVFSRNPSTGALAQLAGTLGCISQDGSDGAGGSIGLCATGRAMFEPTGVAITPDGQSVYLASGDVPSALDTFARSAGTGALTQLPGAEGCLSEGGLDGGANTCSSALGLNGASDVAVTATGSCESVYVVAQDISALASFTRQPTCPAPPAAPVTVTQTTTVPSTPVLTPAPVLPLAPVLTGLRISPTSFRAASSGATISLAKAKAGATISYNDSQAAVATFTVQLISTGIRSHSRCVKAPAHPHGKPNKCSLAQLVGSFHRSDTRGANKSHFSGRVRARKLAPGTYRLRVQSRNATGQTSAVATAGFQIKR